jgi:hypothetical protein
MYLMISGPSCGGNRPPKRPHFYVSINFPDDCVTPDERPYAYYLLNLIHWRHSCCWRRDERGYVPLCDALLRKFIPPKRLTKIKTKLCKAGVIQCDFVAHYGGKGKAYGYRLKPRHVITRRVGCDNDRLAGKIMEAQREEHNQLDPTCRWLRGKLDLLEFDNGRASSVIEGMTPKKRKGRTKRKGPERTLDEYRQLIAEAARRLAGGETWLTRDDYGRVHTPLTSLPSRLRCCLSVGGERLVGLDLKNSQPLFLGLAVRNQINQPHKQPNQQTTNNDASFPDMPSDLRRYLRVCQRGEFYESLACEGKGREAVKASLWQPLFGETRYAYRGWLWERLEAEYPTVAGYVRAVKSHDYKRLAHLLQGEESAFFIRAVCGRIRGERPGLPLYTIHDSLLTTPRHVEYVRVVVMDEFRKMGLVPSLKATD